MLQPRALATILTCVADKPYTLDLEIGKASQFGPLSSLEKWKELEVFFL